MIRHKSAVRETLARRLRQIRRMADLTQEQVADAVGIPRKAIIRIEAQKQDPTFDIVHKWCAATGEDFVGFANSIVCENGE